MSSQNKNWDFDYDANSKRFKQGRGSIREFKLDSFSTFDRQMIRELAFEEFQRLAQKHNIKYTEKKIDLMEWGAKEFIGRKSVFGVKLTTLMKRDSILFRNLDYPVVFSMLLDALEHHGYEEDKLMRKSPDEKKLKEIKRWMATDFYRYKKAVEQELMDNNVHFTAVLLKFFIRCLPDTIFTKKYADAFAKLDGINNLPDRLRAMKMLIFQLPDVNADVLNAYLKVLEKVVAHKEQNNMSADALARLVVTSLFDVKDTQVIGNATPLDNHPPYNLTYMLMVNRAVLFTVPPFILREMEAKKKEIVATKSHQPMRDMFGKFRKIGK